jgi:hypothetical protein
MDTLLLIIGGVVAAGMGFGFYMFIKYMKKNREKVNNEIRNTINEKLRIK